MERRWVVNESAPKQTCPECGLELTGARLDTVLDHRQIRLSDARVLGALGAVAQQQTAELVREHESKRQHRIALAFQLRESRAWMSIRQAESGPTQRFSIEFAYDRRR